MKNLCLSGLAPRFGAVALLVGASGLAATAGCSAHPPSGVGGDAPATSSSGTGGSTATSSASSTSSGGGQGGGGAGGTSSSSGTGGDGGQGGAPFVPPVGTAEYPAETEQNSLKSSANGVQMGTKGFTASLWPLGDIDVFKVDVTVNGSQLTVGIGDGKGGCPVNAQTYLRVFNKSGALVAADKDTGPGSCSLLLPTTTPALQGLAVGTYYLQLENLIFDPLPFYVIDVNIAPPSCGDGFVLLGGGEQCDDGANLAGDGCSPTCKLEGIHGTEVEPNDATATANSLAGLDGIIASIGTLNDQDYFSFAVTVNGSAATLTVDDGLGQCPAGFDSKIYLYDAGGVEITSDNDNGPDSCSTIAPMTHPAAASLAVGTYYVKVEDLGKNTTPFYMLGVKIKTPVCGDGMLQVGEQCDDSNVMSGDGCSATCGFEGNFIPETEPNDNQLTSNPVGTADGLIGSISPIGDQDNFSFDVVTPGSSVFVQVTDGLNGCPTGFDSKLTLFNPGNAMISSVDDGGVAKCSLLSPATTPTAVNMAPGTYRVRVEYSGNTVAVASYVVKIKVVPPSCGDGVIQVGGEQCDDGNVAAGDGCSSTCQAEAPHEIESNNSIATATPRWPGFSNWIGAIYPAGDHDYYTFTLAANSTVTLTTHSVSNAAACPGDTLLHLTSSAGVDLMNNDDAPLGTGVAPCSSLTMALTAGTYYAWVQRYQDMVTIAAYQLDLTVQ